MFEESRKSVEARPLDGPLPPMQPGRWLNSRRCCDCSAHCEHCGRWPSSCAAPSREGSGSGASGAAGPIREVRNAVLSRQGSQPSQPLLRTAWRSGVSTVSSNGAWQDDARSEMIQIEVAAEESDVEAALLHESFPRTLVDLPNVLRRALQPERSPSWGAALEIGDAVTATVVSVTETWAGSQGAPTSDILRTLRTVLRFSFEVDADVEGFAGGRARSEMEGLRVLSS